MKSTKSASGWTRFHQQEDLTTRLRNIISEYPPGLGPFKEFLQNADDAGAEVFSLFYDDTQYPSGPGLLSDGLSQWLGPALYIYNSATFTEGDFDSITRVGQSGKFTDQAKIGKYGLGFNCAYHFTDVVSFVSHDQYVAFDPHGNYLPDETLGLRFNFLEDITLQGNREQLLPFCLGSPFDITMTEPFDGTMFRLPLRRADMPVKSLISNEVYSHEGMIELLQEYSETADSMLLFLKHVREINVFVREDGQIKRLSQVRVENISPKLTLERKLIVSFLKKQAELEIERTADAEEKLLMETTYVLKIAVDIPGRGKRVRRWLVRSCVCESGVQSDDPSLGIQWAGVAACLNGSIGPGRAYCSLSLPIETGLPVHVNANFALTSNRRHLWTGSDMTGAGAFKARWNEMILTGLASRAYAAILERVAMEVQDPADAYAVWPGCAGAVAKQFLPLVGAVVSSVVKNDFKVFYDSVSKSWLPVTAMSLSDPDYVRLCGPKTRKALHSVGIVVADPPAPVVDALMTHAPQQSCGLLSPVLVADTMRSRSPTMKRAQVDEVLQYLLCRYNPKKDSIKKGKEAFSNLINLPLVPTIDGAFTKLLAYGSNKTRIYFASEDVRRIFPGYKSFVDPASASYQKLCSPACQAITTIAALTPRSAGKVLGYMLPSHWHGLTFVPLNDSFDKKPQGAESADTPKKKKKKKNQKTKNRAPAPKPIGDAETKDIVSRITWFWDWIEAAGGNEWKTGDRQHLDAWPLVVLEGEDAVFTIAHARNQRVLPGNRFDSEDRDTLSYFGCKFMRRTSPRFLEALGETIDNVWSPVARHAPSITDLSQDMCRRLRALVLKANNRPSASALDSLPVFQLADGSVGFSERSFFLPPPEWDATMRAAFPEVVYANDAESLRVLDMAGIRPLNSRKFLSDVLLNYLTDMPAQVCVQFLEAMASETGTKGKNSPLSQLKSQRIVVYPDGTRKCPEECIDPEDETLGDLYEATEDVYPPALYRSAGCLKSLRACGMQDLREYDVFHSAALKVQETSNIRCGLQLTRFIITKFRHLAWTSKALKSIAAIEFVPAVDVSTATYPPTHAEIMRAFHDVEFEGYTYGNAPEGSDSDTHEEDEDMASRGALWPVVLTSFRGGCLSSDLWEAWTALKVFHPFVSGTTKNLLGRFGVLTPVPITYVIQHVKILAKLLPPSLRANPDLYASCEKAIMKSCQRLTKSLKSKEGYGSYSVEQELADVAFFLMPDRSFVPARHLCLDLDAGEDLGPCARAPPPYLDNMHKLLVVLGAPNAVGDSRPRVRVARHPPSILPFIKQNINNSDYSDVQFELSSGEVLYGHKLIMASSSEYMRAMFSSGFRESAMDPSTGRTVVRLPEWVAAEHLMLVLQYLYTGEVQSPNRPLIADQYSIDLVCVLLRLADLFIMDHLRSWCEHFLASNAEMSVFNVCDLLQLAIACNGKQLERVCVHHIRQTFQAVSETEAWHNMPQDLKERVTQVLPDTQADDENYSD